VLFDTLDELKNRLKVFEEKVFRKEEIIALKDREIESKNLKIDQQFQQIERLKEELKLALLRQFGRKSERYEAPPEQMSLFDEPELEIPKPEVPEPIEIPSHTRVKSRGKRAPLPEGLEREERVYELPASELVGPNGEVFERIGEEVSEQLDIIPADVKVIRHIRVKYACKSREELGVKIAPMPHQMLPKTMAAPGLLAHMVQAKYEHHLPLYRQESIWQGFDVDIPRNSMVRWTNELGEKLQPLVDRLFVAIKQTGYVNADETAVVVVKDPNKKPEADSHTGRMWVYLNESVGTFFDYQSSRGSVHPKDRLSDFTGYLQVDGYSAYDSLPADQITQVGCMAHVRRKFVDVKKLAGKFKTPTVDHVLKEIQRLYEWEAQFKKDGLTPEEIWRLRQEKSKPILEKLHQYLAEIHPKTPPKGKLGQAIGYALNHWTVCLNYLNDGRLAIDNNAAERAIKPFAVGRKNWLFAQNTTGAKASANLYSLVQSAKTQGLNVFRYLKFLFEEFPNADTEAKLDDLLPHRLAKTQPELKKSQDPEDD
jgi:transposase